MNKNTNTNTVIINNRGGGGGADLGPLVLVAAIALGILALLGAVASMVTAIMAAVASILVAAIWACAAVACVGVCGWAAVTIHAQRTDRLMASNAQAALLERQRLALGGATHAPVLAAVERGGRDDLEVSRLRRQVRSHSRQMEVG